MSDEDALIYARMWVNWTVLRETLLVIQGIAAAAEQQEHSATDHEIIIRADWRLLRTLATDALDDSFKQYPDRQAINARLEAITARMVRTV